MYYSGNYFLTGAILSGATGASYEDGLAETLLHRPEPPRGLTAHPGASPFLIGCQVSASPGVLSCEPWANATTSPHVVV
jgi:hypothetical protein